MGILVQIVQFIVSLTLLVLVHEFGHFLFARLSKTRVEKFYVFFHPWFTIWKKKIGETEFGIGWLPLGGYAKISGMIDESMDKEQMKSPAQPWEYRSKSAGARFMMVTGGVLFNILLAFVIYIGVTWAWGDSYLPNKNVTYGVTCSETAKQIGFQNGDKILLIDGKEVENFQKIVPTLLLDNVGWVTVERNGEELKLAFTDEDIAKIIKAEGVPLFSPRVPFIVGQTMEGFGAHKAGIKEGDKIIGINGHLMSYYDEINNIVPQYVGQIVPVTLVRTTDTLNIPVEVSAEGKLGLYATHYSSLLQFETKHYNFFTAIPAGIKKGFVTIKDYLKQIRLLFQPKTKAYESLGGFIKIGSIFPTIWNWEAFWNLTAFLSIILGVMNILPIPALDGGHMVLIIFEVLTGRKPSDKFMEYAQYVGFFILLALLVYANMNDIIGLFRK